MVSGSRHPKQPIAKALDGADQDGFTVQRAHNKNHLWGSLICDVCGVPDGRFRIHSTPRNPEIVARRIVQFRRQHDH